MELMQNVAKLQTSQIVKATEAAENAKVSVQPVQQSTQQAIKAANEESNAPKIKTESDMERLVKELNSALDPFRTSLRFGYDDTFFVSVIETKSDKIIRRFPAEQAVSILPKIQDLNGFLFDEKG